MMLFHGDPSSRQFNRWLGENLSDFVSAKAHIHGAALLVALEVEGIMLGFKADTCDPTRASGRATPVEGAEKSTYLGVSIEHIPAFLTIRVEHELPEVKSVKTDSVNRIDVFSGSMGGGGKRTIWTAEEGNKKHSDNCG